MSRALGCLSRAIAAGLRTFPPLRERGDDVLLLADQFIRTLGAQMGMGDLTLSRDACELLGRTPGRATSASRRTPSSGAS